VFLINAATFLAVLGVLVWWRGDASAHRKNAPAHRPGSGGT
jgi:hypothetical protein